MRTVLDTKTLAFEEGFKAQEAGTKRNSNPYDAADPTLRQSWFDGWDYADMCNGTCR